MKKYLSIFMCLVLTVLLLSACSTNNQEDIQDEVIFLSDYIHCNITESGKKFGFNLLYLYKGKKPDVSFLTFNDSNADSMYESVIDDTIETIKDKDYNGYKAVILGFCLNISPMAAGDVLQINSISLSVNKNKTTLDTTGQIVIKKVSDSDEQYSCNSIYSTNVPVVLFSQGKNIEAVSFNYHTEDVVTLEKFEISDFLEISDSCVYIDDVKIGNIKDVFPLTVEADKAISIEINADFGSYDAFSDYYINSLLHYKSEADGDKILKDYFAVQAVGNFDDLSKLIDHVTRTEVF